MQTSGMRLRSGIGVIERSKKRQRSEITVTAVKYHTAPAISKTGFASRILDQTSSGFRFLKAIHKKITLIRIPNKAANHLFRVIGDHIRDKQVVSTITENSIISDGERKIEPLILIQSKPQNYSAQIAISIICATIKS